MVLTLRALHAGVRMPDGVVLGYPALNLSMKSFTPSILVSIDDYLLRYNFLLMCINSYIKDGDPDHDPYLSPAFISDEVFRSLVHISVGPGTISTCEDDGLRPGPAA